MLSKVYWFSVIEIICNSLGWLGTKLLGARDDITRFCNRDYMQLTGSAGNKSPSSMVL